MVARREQELTEAHRVQVTQLEEAVTTANRERDEALSTVRRLTEAGILREAKDAVAEALRPVSNLPDITKARLTESAAFNPPLTSDGQLDKPALMKNLEESVKAEAKYLSEATGSGRPFGLGGNPFGGNAGGGGTPDAYTTQLEEALREGFGLDEKAAKSAAGVN
jgi:hypothetical protein